eukprot:jgi/Ulvmu1/5200/UM021_0217.1
MHTEIRLSIKNLVTRVAELMDLPKDYKERLQSVQASLRSAYDRLQTDIQRTVNPSGEMPVDYFLAQAVADLLKSNSERRLFGGYRGDAGIWDRIVLAYQRKGLWTAEAAQQLVWYTEFEIPRLRKTAFTYDRQLQALDGQHDEALKSAQAAFEQYIRACNQAGLRGENVEYELGCAIAKLPQTLQVVLSSLQHPSVEAAIDSYCSLYSGHTDDTLSVLRNFLSDDCEVELQDWPHAIEYLCGTAEDACTQNSKVSTETPGRMCLSASLRPLSASHVNMAASPAAADISSNAEQTRIPAMARVQDDWNISVTGSGTTATYVEGPDNTAHSSISHAAELTLSKSEGHRAMHRLAFEAHYRTDLLNNVHELHGYLLQHIHGRESIPIIPGFLSWDSNSLSHEAVNAAQTMLCNAIEVINRPAVRLLMRASGSKEFTDRSVRNLRMQLMQSQKFESGAAEIRQEQDDVRAKLACVESLRKERQRKSQHMREHLQAAVSAKVKRTVCVPAHTLDWPC